MRPNSLVKQTKETECMAFKINEPSVAMRGRSIMLFNLVNNVKLQSSLEATTKKFAFPLEVPQTDQTSAIRCVRHTFHSLSISFYFWQMYAHKHKSQQYIDATDILLHAVPFQCMVSQILFSLCRCMQSRRLSFFFCLISRLNSNWKINKNIDWTIHAARVT